MTPKRIAELEGQLNNKPCGFADLSMSEARELLDAVIGLRNACEQALPWMIRLGDFIGNGEKDQPMGRCNAILSMRNALEDCYTGPDPKYGDKVKS